MLLRKYQWLTSAAAAMSLLAASVATADEWVRRSFEVAGVKDAHLTFEYPLSWGKKPAYKTFDNVTDVEFGPYGPRSKPFFLVQLQSVPTVDPVNAEQLDQIAEVEISQLAKAAFESEIPVNTLQGEHNNVRYFSITDKVKRWGEFDYLTMAIIGSGNLLTKCYFFSSDGAPDFGADAIRMLESIRYTPPPVDPEEED
tara:strand:+ start:643 stop:1236 length:594 start_codon:yes stop_codon:yes gene_type:complete